MLGIENPTIFLSTEYVMEGFPRMCCPGFPCLMELITPLVWRSQLTNERHVCY